MTRITALHSCPELFSIQYCNNNYVYFGYSDNLRITTLIYCPEVGRYIRSLLHG